MSTPLHHIYQSPKVAVEHLDTSPKVSFQRWRTDTTQRSLHSFCTILPFVAASAPEAEIGALFLNIKEACIFRLTLEELGHPQPATPVHCGNKATTGIVSATVKRHRARSMEMRYFYACDQVDIGIGHFKVLWYPGLENLADTRCKPSPTRQSDLSPLHRLTEIDRDY